MASFDILFFARSLSIFYQWPAGVGSVVFRTLASRVVFLLEQLVSAPSLLGIQQERSACFNTVTLARRSAQSSSHARVSSPPPWREGSELPLGRAARAANEKASLVAVRSVGAARTVEDRFASDAVVARGTAPAVRG